MPDNDTEKESAKRWTYYIETLKRTVDCIYEICRTDQSIIGCKEALMYLTNSVRDFEALIESINVEASWKQEPKPHAVAWEIRKIMSPKNKSKLDGNKDTLIDALKLSPVIIHKAVENAEEKFEQNPLSSETIEDKENQEKKRCTMSKMGSIGDDGWRLVTGRLRRRKPIVGKPSEMKETNEDRVLSQSLNGRPVMNVYERLSSGILRPTNTSQRINTSSDYQLNTKGLMYPRCAMDLPQTKASMAKIAYSRQLLWKKNQSLLAEKLHQKRRQNLLMSRRSGSTSMFSSINFADPVAVARSAEAFKNKQKMQQVPNKHSSNDKNEGRSTFESIQEGVSENDSDLLISVSSSLPNKNLLYKNSEPPLSVNPDLFDGLDADDEWRALTEEEESLVQEEESLKREIEEEESLSIDVELERQVASVDEDLEMQVSLEADAIEVMETKKTESEENCMTTWQDVMNNWKNEMEKYASVSWNEIVEKEIGHYRKPGELAQIHEKLSSPSRKRNPENSRAQEEKQQRAEELRIKLQDEKSNRLKELSKKVEEVRRKREELFERKKEHLERRMEKAAENRQKSLEEIIKKARDDDLKVMEVQFINALEADSVRHSVLTKNQEWEQRMQTIVEERAKKTGEKVAKENAVEERRRTAELLKAEKILEKQVRMEHAEFQRMEQEKERISAVKKKQKGVMERVAEKKANEAAESEKLLKKIQQKQEETRRRYEDTLMHVKQRAVGLSSPRPIESVSSLADFYQLPSEENYNKVMCNESLKGCRLCNVRLESDFGLVAHFLSTNHLQNQDIDIKNTTNESMKTDLDRNVISMNPDSQIEDICIEENGLKSNSSTKKRRNRLRQRIISRSLKFDTISNLSENDCIRPNTTKGSLDRLMRDMLKVIKVNVSETTVNQICKGLTQKEYNLKSFSPSDVHILEKNMIEISKTISANTSSGITDSFAKSFIDCGLFNSFFALLLCSSSGDFFIPSRLACKILSFMMQILSNNVFLIMIFFTERIVVLLDALCVKLKILISSLESETVNKVVNSKQYERHHIELYLLISIFGLISKFLNSLPSSKSQFLKLTNGDETKEERLNAIISLLMMNGFADTLANMFKNVGKSLIIPWKIKLDNDESCVFLSAFTRFISYSEVAECSNIGSLIRPTLYSLSQRIYSTLAAETLFTGDLITQSTRSSALLKSQQDEDELARFLISTLTKMWCMVVKFDSIEAEKYVMECEFPLRLVYIWSHFIVNLEKLLESFIENNKRQNEHEFIGILLHQLIYGIGYFASVHPRAQAFCVLGWQNSLLNHLCALPFKYFSNSSHMAILLPTIIAVCFKNETAVQILQRNLSCQILETFLLEANFDDVPEKKRFKKELWSEAAEFFHAYT